MHREELKTPLHHMKIIVITLFKFNRRKWKTNLVEMLDLLAFQINLGVFMDWGFEI